MCSKSTRSTSYLRCALSRSLYQKSNRHVCDSAAPERGYVNSTPFSATFLLILTRPLLFTKIPLDKIPCLCFLGLCRKPDSTKKSDHQPYVAESKLSFCQKYTRGHPWRLGTLPGPWHRILQNVNPLRCCPRLWVYKLRPLLVLHVFITSLARSVLQNRELDAECLSSTSFLFLLCLKTAGEDAYGFYTFQKSQTKNVIERCNS